MKSETRNIEIELKTQEDITIMEKAMKILDKAGYTICLKTDVISASPESQSKKRGLKI
jgi:phosphoribosylcarboxyaminoimidazole (NCAIR) mutase